MPPRTAYSPGIAHRPGPQAAVGFSQADHVEIDRIARRGRERFFSAAIWSRGGTRCTASLTVVDRMRGRSSSRARPGQPCQRRHALRRDAGVWGHAVVGLAIPGREAEHFDLGRDEPKRALERLLALAVAGDVDQSGRPAAAQAPCQIGDDERIEPSATPASVSPSPRLRASRAWERAGVMGLGSETEPRHFWGERSESPSRGGATKCEQPHEHQR